MESTNRNPKILIVDESRIVRAMIGRHVREHYAFREEGNGEAAWQVLVLDHSIELVICALSLPVLDGNDLLVRVRSSKLPRLARMPMLMIAGDDDRAMALAKSNGASDFVGRDTVGPELLARIDSLLKLSQAQQQLQDDRQQYVQNPDTGLFTRKYIELQAVQAMSHAMRHGSEVSAMVVGFDNVGELRDEHGAEAVEQLQARFIKMLSGKIRKEDSFGHFIGSQFVIVSPGTPYPACESFGNRLRKAIQDANISIHGQRLDLSVSVGVSNTPCDAVSSAGALIELAGARLKAAQQAGGNRVIACVTSAGSPQDDCPGLEEALALLREGRKKRVAPHLVALGKQLLPLLGLLEREMSLGLPMARLEERLGAASAAAPKGGAGTEAPS